MKFRLFCFYKVLVTGSLHLVGDVLKLIKRWCTNQLLEESLKNFNISFNLQIFLLGLEPHFYDYQLYVRLSFCCIIYSLFYAIIQTSHSYYIFHFPLLLSSSSWIWNFRQFGWLLILYFLIYIYIYIYAHMVSLIFKTNQISVAF